MARFAYQCVQCGYFETTLPMRGAPDFARHQRFFGLGPSEEAESWEECPYQAVRLLFMPHFTEDKRRLRVGISPATGRPYAQSRSEEKKIESEMGLEFVTRETRPTEWKEHEAYSKHLSAGGEATPWAPKVAPIKPGTLLKSWEKNHK
jgi:hypothetical protein